MKRRIMGTLAAFLVFTSTMAAQDFLERGQAARAKGDIDAAISNFLMAYQRSPKSAEVNFALGDAYYERGTLDSAEIYLRKAIEYDDELTRAYIKLGTLLSDTKRSFQALVDFKAALKLEKNNFDATLGLGFAYIDIDSTDAANQTLEKAKLLNEKSALPYVGLGRIWEKQRVYNYAIELYQKAVALDPKNVEPHVALANIYLKTKKYTEAINELQSVIGLDAANANAYEKAGKVYLAAAQSGNRNFYANATEMYKKFVELRPTNFEGWMNLGKSYYGNNDFENAVKSFQRAAQINPNSIEAHRMLGYANNFAKNYQQAIEAITWIFAHAQADSLVTSNDHSRAAEAYLGTKDTANAIAQYEIAIKDTAQSEAMNKVAKLYMTQGQYDKAVAMFEQYIVANPKNTAAYYNIGITLMSMKDYSKAVGYFQRGSEQNPDFLPFYMNIASCYVGDQNYTEAIKTYESAIARITADPDKFKQSDVGDLYYYYASTLLVSQRYPAAMQAINKALKYRKEDAQIHILYGQAAVFSFNKDNPDEMRTRANDAIMHLRRALKLEPNNTDAMFWLAQALIQSRVQGEFDENKKKFNEAVDLLNKAHDLNPRDKKIVDFLKSLVG